MTNPLTQSQFELLIAGIRQYYLNTGNPPNAIVATKETMDQLMLAIFTELGAKADAYIVEDEETGNTKFISTYGELLVYINETVTPGQILITIQREEEQTA